MPAAAWLLCQLPGEARVQGRRLTASGAGKVWHSRFKPCKSHEAPQGSSVMGQSYHLQSTFRARGLEFRGIRSS